MRKLLILCGVVGLLLVSGAPAQASGIVYHWNEGVLIAQGHPLSQSLYCDAGQDVISGGYWLSNYHISVGAFRPIGPPFPRYPSGGRSGWWWWFWNPTSSLQSVSLYMVCWKP